MTKKYWISDALGLHEIDYNDLSTDWIYCIETYDYWTDDKESFDYFEKLGRAFDAIDKYRLDLTKTSGYDDVIRVVDNFLYRQVKIESLNKLRELRLNHSAGFDASQKNTLLKIEKQLNIKVKQLNKIINDVNGNTHYL